MSKGGFIKPTGVGIPRLQAGEDVNRATGHGFGVAWKLELDC